MVTYNPSVVSARNIYYGKFATTSRLITTLVSEEFVSAYFFRRSTCDNASTDSSNLVGICLLTTRLANPTELDLLQLKDIYAIVPLRELPELKGKSIAGSLNGVQFQEVDGLHPRDMLPHIYGPVIKDLSSSAEPVSTNRILDDSSTTHSHVSKIISKMVDYESCQGYILSDELDAVDFWTRFVQANHFDEKVAMYLEKDFATAMLYQGYQYDHPKPLPSLKSTSIQWEQSIIEGPHVSPQSIYPSVVSPSVPPFTPDQYSTTFERTKIRLVAIKRECMTLYGNFEDRITPLVKAILKEKAEEDYDGYVLMPVHHMQVAIIREKIPEAIVLPEENYVEAYGLSSVRTVAIPGILDNATLKLTLGLMMGSVVRTIRPAQAQKAVEFTQRVLPWLSYNHDILSIQPEPVSACYKHEDDAVAMHCSCILRESMEYKTDAESDDILVVAAALLEKIQRPDTDETLLTHIWKLDTEEKRARFLDRYLELYLKAVIPSCRDNGVAFDAHGQNTIARFDRSTGELKGFVMRDIDGAFVHMETLKESCGVDFIPDSINFATEREDAYRYLYLMGFDAHLSCLIRVLGMHHNRRGWQMARNHLSKLLPLGHPMHNYFLRQKEVPSLCFIRSVTIQKEVFRPKPNLLFCNQEEPSI